MVRVDTKYVITRDALHVLVDALRDDHDVLEIDGARVFAYETVYFDTGALRSFDEHAAGVVPRFKARTRRYVDTGTCVFEVKVKTAGGETDKHQRDHDADPAELDGAAERHLATTLENAGIEPPGRLEPVLRTSFERATLAHRDGSARLTIDFDVTLGRPGGDSVRIRDGLLLVESKSEDGGAPADRVLRERDAHEVSLSKYRTGIDALLRRDSTGELDGIRSCSSDGRCGNTRPMDDIAIDWGTAEVSDSRLTVAFSQKPSKDWTGRLEAVIDRLAQNASGWGAIEIAKKNLQVDAVEPGAEADLRHFLESALLQANADERDSDANAESSRSERDQALTDAFRAFADP